MREVATDLFAGLIKSRNGLVFKKGYLRQKHAEYRGLSGKKVVIAIAGLLAAVKLLEQHRLLTQAKEITDIIVALESKLQAQTRPENLIGGLPLKKRFEHDLTPQHRCCPYLYE